MRTASLVVALALSLIAPAAALAQPSGPPLEGQRPPGFNPAPPRAAQPPRPQAGASKSVALPQPRWLVTRNVSELSAWVSLSRGLNVLKAGCVAPNSEERWAIDDARQPITVRAAFTRDRACAPPGTCMASVDVPPGVPALDLGAGPGCGLRVAAARSQGLERRGGNEPRPQTCCLVRNSTAYPMWVTVYEGITRGIARTACIQPGKSDWVWAGQVAWMRAEVTTNANCAQPVGCDTTMDVGGDFWTGDRLRGVVLLPNNWAPRGGCWWQFEDSYPRQ
jgi:hypothetical protein